MIQLTISSSNHFLFVLYTRPLFSTAASLQVKRRSKHFLNKNWALQQQILGDRGDCKNQVNVIQINGSRGLQNCYRASKILLRKNPWAHLDHVRIFKCLGAHQFLNDTSVPLLDIYRQFRFKVFTPQVGGDYFPFGIHQHIVWDPIKTIKTYSCTAPVF